MPPPMGMPPVENLGLPSKMTPTEDDELAVVRLVCERVADPAVRAEILAALGLTAAGGGPTIAG